MDEESASFAAHFAYKQRETEVLEYGQSWFMTQALAQDALRQVPENLARAYRLAIQHHVVQTGDVFSYKNRWIPTRLALHREIIDDHFGTVSASNNNIPLAVILLGGPGSGKTSVLRPVATGLIATLGSHMEIVIDSDLIRTVLPEYAGGLGSVVVQDEVVELTYGPVINEAARRRCHMIFDIVGDPDLILDEIDYLKTSGWGVLLLLGSTPISVALQRVMERTVRDGRYVPLSYVQSIADRPLRAYEAVIREHHRDLIGAAHLDTNVALGEAPRIVSSTRPELFGEDGQPLRLWPPLQPKDI